jgi:hypothetical protein
MLTQLLLLRRRKGWLSPPAMHLGSQRSQGPLLANELPDYFAADTKAAANRGQADSASFVRRHNTFPKIFCEWFHPNPSLDQE